MPSERSRTGQGGQWEMKEEELPGCCVRLEDQAKEDRLLLMVNGEPRKDRT